MLDTTTGEVEKKTLQHEGDNVRELYCNLSPPVRVGIDPYDYAEYGFSIVPAQGELIYLLCRSICAKRVVDFATSVGMSALYFAAALRDNGGGTVIG